MYFHAAVREAKRAELTEGLVEALAKPFDAQMKHLTARELVGAGRGRLLGGKGERGGWAAGLLAVQVRAVPAPVTFAVRWKQMRVGGCMMHTISL